MGDTEENTIKGDTKKPSADVLLPSKNSECIEKIEKIHEQSTASTLFKKTIENTSSTIVSVKSAPENKISENKIEKSSKESIKSNKKDVKEENISIITNDSPIPKPRSSRLGGAASETIRKEKIFRNQSDIFSLIEKPDAITSIFSVNGAPSRRVFRKQDRSPSDRKPSPSHGSTEQPPSDTKSTVVVPIPKLKITRENYNDEKRPSSSYRNPLTGTGLSSNDEYTKKENKKKVDGNPLLGLGYGSDAANSHSSHRIPPGGYAHKLW